MFEQGEFFSTSSCLAGDPETTATDDANAGGSGLVAVPVSPAPIHPNHGWHLTRHVCRVCFGRILTRCVPGLREFICSNCETTASRSRRDARSPSKSPQ